MEERILINRQIQNYSDQLIREEKSNATYDKYSGMCATFRRLLEMPL